jgi:hypothetical protein
MKLRALSFVLLILGLLAASQAGAIILPSCQNDCNCSRPCTTKCVDDNSQELLTCDRFICSGRCVAAVAADSETQKLQEAHDAIFAEAAAE